MAIDAGALPSALLLAGLGLGLASGTAVLNAGALHGLKVVAVAVVAQAVWGMARTLCVGRARVTLMVLAAGLGPFAGTLALAAADCVFVDDQWRNVEGGRRADMFAPATHAAVARCFASRSCAELDALGQARDIPIHSLKDR